MKRNYFFIKLFLILSSLLCPYYFGLIVPNKLLFSQLPLEFSEENLIKVIKESPVVFKDILLAQIIKETGHYTSDLFTYANNLCGMRLPKSRENLAVGSYKGYALYTSWIHSIDDYVLWQIPVVEKYKTREEYLSYLGRNYAEDSAYVKAIRIILQNNKERFSQAFD